MSKNAQTVAPEPPIKIDAMLCFAIYGAAHAFTRTYKPLLEPLGLTYPQYLVMVALWEEDAQTVKALGERLGLDSGTLSPLLKRLEQAGLVARKRNREDERQVNVHLTEQGLTMKAEAASVTANIGKAIGCSLDEAVALRDAVNALKGRLDGAE
ncbi:MarR family winged helix-turn-helix transcriptional regulator [Neorhizobium alkalisoli]|uniref:MarR family transcriptional regulator n=1 Tax=Neorhizobium alkalisoli TaxID=528178 RepID=A0A561R3C3_9HYPH|nr:MarR family transcriptional regulator [Neorhizobium alkalisoli]TWF57073.1 MarR family transcriptional regulator [Neorhizobium alkalisoli]